MENYRMHAKTFYGFETILAKEIAALGGADVKVGNRMVTFSGDNGFLYKANYSLRTALRILKPIASFRAETEDELYDKCYDFHWENIFSPEQSFRIDFTVNSRNFKHSQFAALRLKDAIVDRFRDRLGERPNVSKNQPDIYINLHISHSRVNLSLDSSGEPLFKRGYRKETGPAPINEVMAAGLLELAGWDGKGNLLDPMCGSGTLLIEAAMKALHLPAQLHRTHFAFENWKDFDQDLYNKIRSVRLDKVKDFHGKIIGYDSSLVMKRIADRNIEAADLTDFIEVKQMNFFQSKKEHSPLLVVFNPPYNQRMEIKIDDFYRQIGDTLKQGYPHTRAWFITSDTDAYRKVGLRPENKIKLYNGKLDAHFLQYEIYNAGTKKND